MRTKTGLYFPKKGSPEAKAWAKKMQAARKRKRGLKKNPGATWHRRQGDTAKRLAHQMGAKGPVKAWWSGYSDAHFDSASAAQRLGMNRPKKKRKRRRVKQNPLAIYNRPNPPGKLLYKGWIEIRGLRVHGKYAGKYFKHTFKGRAKVEMRGMPDKSVIIRSMTGVPLWGMLDT